MLTPAGHRQLARDPVMRRLIRRHGPCGIEPRRWSPYEALTRAIAHQQLNGRAAQTILARFVALFGNGPFPHPGPGARHAPRAPVQRRLFAGEGARRPDVLPVDDFGVREGYRRAYGARRRPTPKALRRLGERWKPYRSAAAWYFWRAAGEPRPVPKKRG